MKNNNSPRRRQIFFVKSSLRSSFLEMFGVGVEHIWSLLLWFAAEKK